jgi:diguanylate cyclase (GGDEF)-like protein
MLTWNKSTFKSLFLPGGVLFLLVLGLVHSGWLTLAVPALSFLYYCALVGGMLLAWRFHSSRIFLSLCVLFIAQEGISLLGAGQTALVLTAVRATAVILAFDFVLIALMHERGFRVETITPMVLLLFVQWTTVAALCRTAGAGLHSSVPGQQKLSGITFPAYIWVIFLAAEILLLGRFLLTGKLVEAALLWAQATFFLSLHSPGNARAAMAYAATAACILSASIIETSYLLAYHDELTGLPSRRAFNDALLRLEDPYSIAVVDIDHFKRFNDTYGHDTGDQVLRLVASNLARVTGGGRAYRCGGEEFTVLFPGKTTPEVVDPLEQLREQIEGSQFRMRGTDRRQKPRGSDRRKDRVRRRPGKGQPLREPVQENQSDMLSVTVSIGIASSSKLKAAPDAVLKSADKALYRAKANGRNRVETASLARRAGARAAGIA